MENQNHEISVAANRDIELFLNSTGPLFIDRAFALQEFFAFIADLRLRESGVPYEQLGISERRASCLPRIITQSDNVSAATLLSVSDGVQSLEGARPGSIALMQLNGVMRMRSGISTRGVDAQIQDLRAAYNNPNIDGIIVETNSGGGEAVAGAAYASAIAERNKPVVSLSHMAASAAYMAVAGMDEVIAASPLAHFGSIGAMMQIDKTMIEELKKKYLFFYGKDAPKKNEDHQLALTGDYSGIQTAVDQYTAGFHDIIKNARNLRGSESKVKETLNGSMWPAQDAKARGLVDMVGNMRDAVRRVNALKSKYKN